MRGIIKSISRRLLNKVLAFMSIRYFLCKVLKNANFFSVKHSKYVKERIVRRFLFAIFIVYFYIGYFIDFCCWLVLFPTSVENTIGYFINNQFGNLSLRYCTILKLVFVDWWFDEQAWVFYFLIFDYFHQSCY